MKKNTGNAWRERAKVIFAIFLTVGISACSSMPDSLNLAYPIRPAEPKLYFKDTGQHCLKDEELDALSTYILGVHKYQETTEAIIDSVNKP